MENCILSLSGVRKVFWCFVKGTCLRLSWFPFFSFFYYHFSLWTFGGSTGNFFSGSQSLLSFSGSLKLRFSFTGKTQKALLTQTKIPCLTTKCPSGKVHVKKKWKPASPKARPFSCTRKTLRTPERYKNRPFFDLKNYTSSTPQK